MKLALVSAALVCFAMALPALAADTKGALDFTVDNIDGTPVDLSKYKGEVLLIVNVASHCGYTPQYKNLEEVYTKYKGDGFKVLGFPANEFGKQEPGDNKQIAEFCSSKFHVDFPMFAKIVVKGNGISPLYQFLTSKDSNPGFDGDVKWNFEKFLVGRDGKVVKRWRSAVKPDSPEVIQTIESELKKKS